MGGQWGAQDAGRARLHQLALVPEELVQEVVGDNDVGGGCAAAAAAAAGGGGGGGRRHLSKALLHSSCRYN